MKAIMVNESDGEFQHMTGFDRIRGNWIRGYDKYFISSSNEKISEDFWNSIFDRLNYYNSGGGGGFDYQAVVDGFVNGVGLIEWTVEQYIEKWENDHGVKMTVEQKDVLSKGCVGIVALELGITSNPSVLGGYYEFKDAKAAADAFQANIDLDPEFKAIYGENARVVLYGFLFYDYTNRFKPGEDGRVDMSKFSFAENEENARFNEETNFDYGLYDASINKMIDANNGVDVRRSEKMMIYAKSVDDFIAGFGNRRVFLFSVTNVPLKKQN